MPGIVPTPTEPGPVYDKVTPGPIGVGTRYREVVQVLPFVRGEVLTEVEGYEPGRRLAYRFVAMGMPGDLTYDFEFVEAGTRPDRTGTRVVQRQSLCPQGLLKPFSPLIGWMFYRMVDRRLVGIKHLLEAGGLS